MKKTILIILIIVLVIAVLLLLGLHGMSLHDDSDILLLAQYGAREAYTSFTDFKNNGEESDYLNGVASFYLFQQSYYLLVEETNKSANYIFCNEVYGSLILSPEQAKLHISEILEVMKILADNVRDENGYVKMAELRNILK